MTDNNDGNSTIHAPAGGFMARLRKAEANARARHAPWEQVLSQQAILQEDMRELQQRLRTIEDGFERLARDQRRRSSSDND